MIFQNIATGGVDGKCGDLSHCEHELCPGQNRIGEQRGMERNRKGKEGKERQLGTEMEREG